MIDGNCFMRFVTMCLADYRTDFNVSAPNQQHPRGFRKRDTGIDKKPVKIHE